MVFPDAERALREYLAPLWAARADVFEPATITNKFPATALAGNATHLQVELDGTPTVEYPATERATVRFTFWSAPSSQDNAKNGAAVTQAFVATHPGDDDVWSTRILTGRLKGVDPDTRNNFVSFTARVSLRPQAL